MIFNMKLKYLGAIFLLLVAGTASWLYFISNQRSNHPGWTLYTNPKYGYKLEYPTNYLLIDTPTYDYQTVYASSTIALLGTPTWLDIEVSGGDYGTTPQDFVKQAAGITPNSSGNLSRICDSDGPTGGTSCDKILKQNSWVNPAGVACYELYFEQIEHVDQTDTQPAFQSVLGPIGPLYTCDITNQTNHLARALLITPQFKYPKLISLSQAEIDKIKALINSMHF